VRHEASVDKWKGELLKSAERGKELHNKLKDEKAAGKKAAQVMGTAPPMFIHSVLIHCALSTGGGGEAEAGEGVA
jgi:hypothetical protein